MENNKILLINQMAGPLFRELAEEIAKTVEKPKEIEAPKKEE